MTVGAAEHGAPARGSGPERVGWPPIAALAAALLVVLLCYGVGVLLPYVVNDLHRLPLSQVESGAHDPKDLWPRGAWAGVAQLAGFLSLTFGPLAAVASAGLGVVSLLQLRRSDEPARTAKACALLLLVAVGVAVLAYMVSDTGAALRTWRLD